MSRVSVPAGRLWILGELFGDLCTTSALEAWAQAPDPSSWRADRLNGHFLLVAYEEARGRWHVWTDRFGTCHCYHLSGGEEKALSTCCRTLESLPGRGELDWEGISAFCTLGFFPDDRTWFRGIRVLKPARHYIYENDLSLVSSSRYWNWMHEPEEALDQADWVEEFAETFGQVVGEMSAGCRLAVPISGGLDARSTVAALPSDVDLSRLWAYSYGYSQDSIETRLAQGIAKARNLPFCQFTIGQYLFEDLEQILAAVEGFQDLTQCRQAYVRGHIAANADRVLAAHWGDVWLNDMGTTKLPTKSAAGSTVFDALWNKIAKRGHHWLVRHLCIPNGGKESALEYPKEWMRSSLGEYEGIEDVDFRLKAWKTDHWSFRWTLASIRMFQAAAFPRLPFYDTRLSDLFLKTPTREVSARRLQIEYLKRHAPAIARVPWQKTGVDLFRAPPRGLGLWWVRALQRVRRWWHADPGWSRNWEVQFRGKEGKRGLEAWLSRSGLAMHNYVERRAVTELLDSFKPEEGNAALGYAICLALTISTKLQRAG